MNFQISRGVRVVLVLLTVLSIALQIQVTFLLAPALAPLRVSLADFLLPPLAFYILLSFILHRSFYPSWRAPYVEIWLAALIVVMSLALFTGWQNTGSVSSWSFLNKYIGLLILIAYFGAGGWIGANLEKADFWFIRIFCGFYFCVLLASALSLMLEKFVPFDLWLPDYSWDGFMANRNAFMLLSLMVLVLIEAVRLDPKLALPSWFYACFWILLPLLALYNASRAGWIIGSVILVAVFIFRPRIFLQKISPFFLIGTALAAFSFMTVAQGDVDIKEAKQFRLLVALVDPEEGGQMYSGDQKRLIAVEDGFELFEQSNPLLGGGLGSYKDYQILKRGEFIDIIDFTALWLLVETGLLGLVVFGGFFCLCLWVCYREGFYSHKSFFHRGLFFFLLVFIAMSFLHELMYTRFLWFVMGIGMAVSLDQISKKNGL